jgi:hypothetical protein
LHLLAGISLWSYRHVESRSPNALVTGPIMIFELDRPLAPPQADIVFSPLQNRPRLTAPSAISVPLPPEGETEAQPDWGESAKNVAARIAAQMSEGGGNPPPPASAPKQFGWDSSRTKRWEQAPEGGTVVRLNDHCQIIFNPLPIGGCALGKIEPRGDLFEGMREHLDSSDARSSAPMMSPRTNGAAAKPALPPPPNGSSSGTDGNP